MPALRDRQRQPEWMDDPALDAGAHRRALDGLARLNWLANSAGTLWRALRPLLQRRAGRRPVRVLDLACGGGDVTLGLWQRAQRAGLPLALTACDASDVALATARARAHRFGADIDWRACDVLHEPWPGERPEEARNEIAAENPGGYDVVVSSLFLHHLEPNQVVDVLRRAASAAEAVRMLDLTRGRGGWLLACGASALSTRSPVVRCDAPRSVEGAFTVAEIEALTGAAGLEPARVQRRWPARWLLQWERSP